jgi:ubiquinone/menaquinone biosynthesis C-methylase UbiE
MDDTHHDVLFQYYSARAPIYDAAYTGTPQPWVQTMIAALQTTLVERDVLEIACGTGHWTTYAAQVARTVTASDTAPAMLALARQKLHAHPNVTIVAGDAYQLEQITGDFTAGFAIQWFSHIPKAQLSDFLRQWHRRLGSGAAVFLADNQRRTDDRDPLFSRPGDPNTYELRTLPDRSQYTIIKNYYTADELRQILVPSTNELQITMGERWWWLSYTVGRLDA